MNFISKIFGSRSKRRLSFANSFVKKINSLEEKTEELSDQELQQSRSSFIERHQSNETLDELLP